MSQLRDLYLLKCREMCSGLLKPLKLEAESQDSHTLQEIADYLRSNKGEEANLCIYM